MTVYYVVGALVAVCAVLFADIVGGQTSSAASHHLSILALKIMVLFITYQIWFQKFMFKAALSVAYLGKDKFALLILKYLGPKRCPLYFYQNLLPELPLPKPQDTIKRWLASVKPLISEDQMAEVTAAAQEFLEKDANELQNVLVARAKANPNGNWLEKYWLDFAYLRGRDALVTNVNYFCTDSSDNMLKVPFETDPCRRAALLISAAIDCKYRVDNGTLECLRIGGTVPICMDGFKKVPFSRFHCPATI